MRLSEFKRLHPGVGRALAVTGMSEADFIRKYNRGIIAIGEAGPTKGPPLEKLVLDSEADALALAHDEQGEEQHG